MKKWLSVTEMIAKLEQRGMDIGDPQKAAAALERFGYYRLSGYWYLFRKSDSTGERLNDFKPQTMLSDIVDLYIFDKKLRLLCLDALERIELAIQVDIAHTLGKRSPLAHLDFQHLNSKYVKHIPRRSTKSDYDKWAARYQALKNMAKARPFVRHNLNQYRELPIWVAVEILDFGALSHLFKMMKQQDRDQIAEKYGLPDGKILEMWLRSMTYMRNVSAHHQRLWNSDIKDHASVPKSFAEIAQTDQHRAFRYLCIMQHFLSFLCPQSTWKNRVAELLIEFPAPQNECTSLTGMGVVEGWEEWALWAPQKKTGA